MPEYITPPRVFINGRELPGVESLSIDTYADQCARVDIDVSEAVARYVNRELTHAFQAAVHEGPWRIGHPRNPPASRGIRPNVATFDEVVGAIADVQGGPAPTHLHEIEVDDGKHEFEQHPEEEAKLCFECGMWPEHHAHRTDQQCVCTACMPDASALPHGHYATVTEYRSGYDDQF